MYRYFISLFLKIIKRFQRARLRRIMRGYRRLKQSGQLARIATVKEALTERPLGLGRKHFSSVVMGRGVAYGEIVVRQYLLVRIGWVNLNRALLLVLSKKRGRVVFPLPKEWRSILAENDFEVAHFRSSLLWQLYVCAIFLFGALQICKIAFAGFSAGKSAHHKQKRHVFFVDLGPGNLPQNDGGSQSHDVISWYLQWHGRYQDIEAIHHSVVNSSSAIVSKIEILPQKGVLPPLAKWKSVCSYLFWGFSATVIAAVDCLRGRWWHALLLNQAALAAQVRNVPPDSLAREYLFHNSGSRYRPLWTYEAESRGSAVLLYFYSTNCEAFKRPEGYPPIPYGWKAMNWPRYLVWDEYQADFVRRAVGRQANISIVGPIWFQGSSAEMPKLDKPGVAVFDVTPNRASQYSILGLDSEFYVPEVATPFLEHVGNVAQKYDVLMMWKGKRNIGPVAHPYYRAFLERLLAENSHVVPVAPDISAIRVIESSIAVISMPFTSTALIAKEMGKPSAYYDPCGILQRDDRAAHGIPILSGVKELETWLSAQIGFH